MNKKACMDICMHFYTFLFEHTHFYMPFCQKGIYFFPSTCLLPNASHSFVNGWMCEHKLFKYTNFVHGISPTIHLKKWRMALPNLERCGYQAAAPYTNGTRKCKYGKFTKVNRIFPSLPSIAISSFNCFMVKIEAAAVGRSMLWKPSDAIFAINMCKISLWFDGFARMKD